MSSDGVRHLMDDIGGTVHGETVPFLHGGAVYGFFVVLRAPISNWSSDPCDSWSKPTENVIHEIGSASGMSVFLTNSSVSASSSNATV